MAESTKRAELVDVARRMLLGNVGILEGARQIDALRFALNDPDNDLFTIFCAIASDTDHIPLGDVRNRSSASHLRRANEEMARYVAAVREDALAACKEIVKAFS